MPCGISGSPAALSASPNIPCRPNAISSASTRRSRRREPRTTGVSSDGLTRQSYAQRATGAALRAAHVVGGRVEDPLHEQDVYNYVKLKQHLAIPILATEYPISGLESYQPWIMNRATDYLRGDVAVNLAATSLGVNAYLYTGEKKYADWEKNQVFSHPNNLITNGMCKKTLNGWPKKS